MSGRLAICTNCICAGIFVGAAAQSILWGAAGFWICFSIATAFVYGKDETP